MIPAQSEALVHLPPASFSSGGTALLVFDRSGFDYATVDISFGALATNAATLAVISLTEGESTSSMATFTGSSIAANWAVATLGQSVGRFQVDLRKRKRYLALNITNATTTVVIGAIARLSRAGQSNDTAAEQSVASIGNTSAIVSNVTTL